MIDKERFVGAYLPLELKKRLREEAKERGITMSALIREKLSEGTLKKSTFRVTEDKK